MTVPTYVMHTRWGWLRPGKILQRTWVCWTLSHSLTVPQSVQRSEWRWWKTAAQAADQPCMWRGEKSDIHVKQEGSAKHWNPASSEYSIYVEGAGAKCLHTTHAHFTRSWLGAPCGTLSPSSSGTGRALLRQLRGERILLWLDYRDYRCWVSVYKQG